MSYVLNDQHVGAVNLDQVANPCQRLRLFVAARFAEAPVHQLPFAFEQREPEPA